MAKRDIMTLFQMLVSAEPIIINLSEWASDAYQDQAFSADTTGFILASTNREASRKSNREREIEKEQLENPGQTRKRRVRERVVGNNVRSPS